MNHETSEDSFQGQDALLVAECMTYSLTDALRKSRIKSIEDKLKITTDGANTLAFLLSNKRVVHRHLKPEKTLLKLEDDGQIGHAKLSDFRCSRRVNIEHTKQFLSTAGYANGTPLFRPP